MPERNFLRSLIVLSACAPAVVWANKSLTPPDVELMEPDEAGRALAEFAEDYHAGWGDLKSRGRMVLIDNQGVQSEKVLQSFTLERDKKQDGRAIIIFDEKVGTALITFANQNKADNQWVWFPGMRRKYRVKADNESNAFIGSEFSYEDLRSQYADKYEFELLWLDEFDGQLCWVLKRLPTNTGSGYSHHVAWMDQEHFRILKVEFYDKQQRHMKTSVASDWKQYDGKWWYAERTHMVNHLTGRESTILVDELEYGVGYTVRDFKAGFGILR